MDTIERFAWFVLGANAVILVATIREIIKDRARDKRDAERIKRIAEIRDMHSGRTVREG